MAALGFAFDATAVTPDAPRGEVLPAGDYLVQIINSEMRETKAGTGSYLALELEVIDGEYQRRHLFDNLNLMNANPKTVEIAQRTLSAICHAVGVMNVADSEQLHFKPMLASVIVLLPGTDKNGYVREQAKNEVKGYKPKDSARTAAPAAPRPVMPGATVAAATATVPAAANSAKPPPSWLARKTAAA